MWQDAKEIITRRMRAIAGLNFSSLALKNYSPKLDLSPEN